MSVFVDSQRKLRNGWWLAIFFALLAILLFPLLLVTRQHGGELPFAAQFAVVAIASAVCQRLRGRPIAEITGRIDRVWAAQLMVGLAGGVALMIVPAAILLLSGAVRWTWSGATLTPFAAGVSLCAAVAATEELLFRGFPFQRLVDGTNAAVAQVVLAAYFVLTHSDALDKAGSVRPLAMANLFVASLLFGLARLRTKRLAMPLGLHFAANFTQGTILGFGVSGSTQPRLLIPHAGNSPEWLTGGVFGLEASVGGLIVIVAATVVLGFRRTS